MLDASGAAHKPHVSRRAKQSCEFVQRSILLPVCKGCILTKGCDVTAAALGAGAHLEEGL